MRRELVTSFVLAAMMCGCGYDDGKEAVVILQALPDSCATSTDCTANGALIGVCEDFVCRRSCTETNDCEDNAICESGVCRPVVACPQLNFSHLSGDALSEANKYNNRKCIKVFSHTPSLNWRGAATSDVVLDQAHLNSPNTTGDFTSTGYNYILPNAAMRAGMMFASVTYASERYVKLLTQAATDAAACFKPEVLDTDTYRYKPMEKKDRNEDSDWNDYQTTYTYSFSDAPINFDVNMMASINIEELNKLPDTDPKKIEILTDFSKAVDVLQQLCVNPTWLTELDMEEYASRLRENAYTEYIRMLNSKPECITAIETLTHLDQVGDFVGELGGGTKESGSGYAAQLVIDLLQNGPNKTQVNNSGKLLNEAINDKFENFNALATGLGNYLEQVERGYFERMQAAGLFSGKQYGDGLCSEGKTIDEVCAELIASKTVAACPTFCQSGKLKSTQVKSIIANFINIAKYGLQEDTYKNVADYEKGVCAFILVQTASSSAFKRYSTNPDFKLGTCMKAQRLDSSLLPDKLAATHEKPEELVYAVNEDVLYNTLTDPTKFWMNGKTLLPLQFTMPNDNYVDGLILSINYTTNTGMFTDGLIEDTNIIGFPDSSLAKLEFGASTFSGVHLKKADIESLNNKAPSAIAVYTSSGGTTSANYILPADSDLDVPNNRRTLYLDVRNVKSDDYENDTHPMACGGMVYNGNTYDGYVVIDESKVKYSGRAVGKAQDGAHPQ